MDQQSESQAPAKDGTPTPVPASAPENQNQNQTQAQTPSQPQNPEERVQAWDRAFQQLDDLLTGVIENLYIAEDRMRHSEEVTTRRTTDVNTYSDLFTQIHLRHATFLKDREQNPVPSEVLLNRLEGYVQTVRNNQHITSRPPETTQKLSEEEKAWFEEHRQRIERFQGYRENTPGRQVLGNFLEGRRSLKYHKDQLKWRREKLEWHRAAVNYHETAILQIRRGEYSAGNSGTGAPSPVIDLANRTFLKRPAEDIAPGNRNLSTRDPFGGGETAQPFAQRRPYAEVQKYTMQPPVPGPATRLPIPGPAQLPVLPNQGQGEQAPPNQGEARPEPRQRPYRPGGAAPFWTEEEENWLIVNTMYPGASTKQLAANLPGGNSRTHNSITGHMGEMRLRGRLPSAWTINAPQHYTHPWTIEEDMELLRWHANDRTVIDATVFIEHNRSGTAAYRRARFLIEDEELERRAIEVEMRQRAALLEADASSDVQMTGDETAEEEEATEELRQAITQSLSSRPHTST